MKTSIGVYFTTAYTGKKNQNKKNKQAWLLPESPYVDLGIKTALHINIYVIVPRVRKINAGSQINNELVHKA